MMNHLICLSITKFRIVKMTKNGEADEEGKTATARLGKVFFLN